MSEYHARIDHVRQQVIADPHISDEHKDAIVDMLLKGKEATNGAEDKIAAMADCLGAIAVMIARRELTIPRLVTQAMKEHVSTCAMMQGAGGRFAALFPWRWPLTVVLCVALVSPYVGPVLAKASAEYFAKMEVRR